VAGDPVFNASVLKTFRYIPSVSGAIEAFGITAKELKDIGVLAQRVNVEALRKNAFPTLANVPDTVE
jgi:NitT/TauT family transport system substrate-binding protein